MQRDLSPDSGAASTTTPRIQHAIDEVARAGGGRVSLGPGLFVSGTIVLASGVELHLRRGCVLQASPDLSVYPRTRPGATNKDQTPFHLLLAEGCGSVALTGSGVIDGQMHAFLEECVGEEDRPYGIFRTKLKGGPDSQARPNPLLEFRRCQDLIIQDVHVRQSPGWTLHLYDCSRAQVRHVTIRNDRMAVNSDGIGINGCRDVIVSHCDVQTGDDAIVLKATDAGVPCERVIVSHCIASSNCSALGLGAETLGGIRDVVFSHCLVPQSLRMIQIEMWDPGCVENVTFTDIAGATFPDPGVTCERPIYLDIQQFLRPSPVLGTMRNLAFRNLSCRTRGRIVMTAQDGSAIRDVRLEQVRLEVPQIEDPTIAVPAARSMQNSNFNPHTRAARAAVVADNVQGLLLRDVHVRWPDHPSVSMQALHTRQCTGVVLESPGLRPAQGGGASLPASNPVSHAPGAPSASNTAERI